MYIFAEECNHHSVPQNKATMKKICKLISDYMGVLVLLSAVLALLTPGTFSGMKLDYVWHGYGPSLGGLPHCVQPST